MGLARSNVRDLLRRDDGWTDGRSHRTPSDDEQLLAELRQEIVQLPSYGYRRACALVNRQRTARGAPRVNAKRVYRVMAGASLLLPKAPRRRQSAERVNDFATPSVMNLLCRAVDCGWGVSPEVAG